MKAKVAIKKDVVTTVEVSETKPIRITDDAHRAAKVHVAKSDGTNICEYVSSLIINDATRKK